MKVHETREQEREWEKNTRVRHTNIIKYLTRKFPDNFPAICTYTKNSLFTSCSLLSSHADNLEEMSRVAFVKNVNTTHTHEAARFPETLRLQHTRLCAWTRKFSFILHQLMRERESGKLKSFTSHKSLIELNRNQKYKF